MASQVRDSPKLAAKLLMVWYPWMHAVACHTLGLTEPDDLQWDDEDPRVADAIGGMVANEETMVLITAWLVFECARRPGVKSIESMADAFTSNFVGRDDGDAETPPDDPGDLLFGNLDQLLIRATIAVTSEVEGTPSIADHVSTVEELLRLNSDRRQSWFHPGFTSVPPRSRRGGPRGSAER